MPTKQCTLSLRYVVVTIYKRGAREVQRRLVAQPRATAEEAAQEAAARQARAAAQAARARAQPAR